MKILECCSKAPKVENHSDGYVRISCAEEFHEWVWAKDVAQAVDFWNANVLAVPKVRPARESTRESKLDWATDIRKPVAALCWDPYDLGNW